MADINLVVLVGRLTKDAELKFTANALAVTRLSLAVNRRKKQDDKWVDEVSYFDAVLWGKLGETLKQYLVKGKQLAIEGELRQNRWEQDGQTRSKVEVVVNNLQLLGGGQGRASETHGQPVQAGYDAAVENSTGAPSGAPTFEDDIPF